MVLRAEPAKSDLRGVPSVARAQSGGKGGKNGRKGARGLDLVIPVPVSEGIGWVGWGHDPHQHEGCHGDLAQLLSLLCCCANRTGLGRADGLC